MKPHPRIRKTIKWGGAAVTVLLVVVWIGSGWWALERHDTHVEIRICSGFLETYWMRYGMFSPDRCSWDGGYVPPRGHALYNLRGRWGFSWNEEGDIGLTVPLWALALAAAAATAHAWHLDTLARRRAGLDLCPKCHYDRTGLAAGAKCPECGSAFEPQRGSRA